jgi:hypothetical protein
MHTFPRLLSGMGVVFAAALASALLPAPAQAQYTGEAYILRLNAGVGAAGLIGIGVGASVNHVTLPYTGGGPVNGAQNGLNLNLGPNQVTASVISSSTIEAGGQVTSDATVTGANIFPNFSSLLPNNLNVLGNVLGSSIGIGGLATVNLNIGFLNVTGSLLNATVIQAHAVDNQLVPAFGFSNIVGLTALSNAITADGTIAQHIPINLTVNVTGTVNVLGNALLATNVSGSTSVQIGELIINEQLPQPTDPELITVNAVHLRLFPDVDLPNLTLTGNIPVIGGLLSLNIDLPTTNVLGVTAGTDLIISSATAGVAPEPGTLALLAVGGLSMVGLRLRRKQSK